MKHAATVAALAALGAFPAHAGGVERSTQSIGILFEEGTYAELSFSAFNADVSGTALGGFSGDMTSGYGTYALSYKQALGENLDLALILDQPIGADVNYPAGTGYIAQGATAKLDSNAVTALLRYKLPSNISLIGGLRALQTEGTANLPYIPPGGYTLSTSAETDYGYVLGIAWERPDIAARVALSYNSAIEHDFTSVENGNPTSFGIEVPQSLNLEFQTGIAADTLLFGSVRWVDWTAFDIAPPLYVLGAGEPLVFYDHDIITYNLGVGRRFSDTWSGAVLLGYEEHKGDPVGNLGPTDGYTSIGFAATYTRAAIKITGGIRYVDIGDARTRNIGGVFDNNEGWGAGIRIGYQF